MQDAEVISKVNRLFELTKEYNDLLAKLEDLNVEVRVGYVESKPSDNKKQGIKLYRVIEHHDYLN